VGDWRSDCIMAGATWGLWDKIFSPLNAWSGIVHKSGEMSLASGWGRSLEESETYRIFFQGGAL
jgi:hypothetical protein